MSEKNGLLVVDDQSSMQTRDIVDQEAKKILQESYERAKLLLKTHQVELKLLAETLLQKETLDAEQIKNLIENHKL